MNSKDVHLKLSWFQRIGVTGELFVGKVLQKQLLLMHYRS
jgi:hypothetical protein